MFMLTGPVSARNKRFVGILVQLFVAATRDCNRDETTYTSRNVQLHVSHDHGKTFSPVCFPVV